MDDNATPVILDEDVDVTVVELGSVVELTLGDDGSGSEDKRREYA